MKEPTPKTTPSALRPSERLMREQEPDRDVKGASSCGSRA